MELSEFLKKANKLLSSDERVSIVNYIAAHPAAGDLIQGKGEKANLAKVERNELAKLTALLRQSYGGRYEQRI